jgi:hypothetical protein
MASERTEQGLRDFLAHVGLTERQIDQAVQITLDLAPKPSPKKRRCGASLPYEDGSQGWMYCELESGHAGRPHMDPDGLQWTDDTIVEVTTVEEIRAVPDHVHDFVGDEDTCVREQECQLTWGERMGQDREWGMDHG